MESYINNRMLLVFVLGKLKDNYQKDDQEIQTAVKMSCSILSSQILRLKFKTDVIGMPDIDSSLFEKETLSKKECFSHLENLYSQVDADPCRSKYEQTEPSFSHMSIVMLKGSFKIITDRLKEELCL